MPCNTGQRREQKTLFLCRICKPLQRPATTDRTLVMSRSAVRVRSSAPLFSRDLQEKGRCGRTRSSLNYGNRTATRVWVDLCCGHKSTSLTVLGDESSEVRATRLGLPMYGVFRSSRSASNPNPRQRYCVWGMCRYARSWYGTPKCRQRLLSASRRTSAPRGAKPYRPPAKMAGLMNQGNRGWGREVL